MISRETQRDQCEYSIDCWSFSLGLAVVFDVPLLLLLLLVRVSELDGEEDDDIPS